MAQQDQAKSLAQAATKRGEKLLNSYVERLATIRPREKVKVSGNDFFGSVCGENVWADTKNEIEEAGLPLDARRELARGYSAAVTFMDFQVS